MKTKIFEEILVKATKFHQLSATIHHWMKCYKVTREPDDNDPLNVNISKSEGMRTMEGFAISSDQFMSQVST